MNFYDLFFMKIKFLKCVPILCCLLLFTGCSNEDIKLNLDQFNLNFRYFLLPNTDSIESVKIDSLDLEQETIKLENIEKMDGIIYKAYSTCANKDFYNNNFEKKDIFYDELKDSINKDYLNKIMESNDFKKSLDNIFDKSDTEFYDSEIISLNNINNNKYYEVEIVCVNNEKNFLIEYVDFYVDNENKITNIKLLDDLQSYENTIKPLNKDSLLNKKNIHKDFINSFNNLKDSLTNGQLYTKYELSQTNQLSTESETKLSEKEKESKIKEYKKEMKSQVNNLIKSLNSPLDNKTLKKFFIEGEGTFSNTFITGYKINDVNGLANSVYTIKTVSNGKTTTFLFTFSRIDKEITNITILKDNKDTSK